MNIFEKKNPFSLEYKVDIYLAVNVCSCLGINFFFFLKMSITLKSIDKSTNIFNTSNFSIQDVLCTDYKNYSNEYKFCSTL